MARKTALNTVLITLIALAGVGAYELANALPESSAPASVSPSLPAQTAASPIAFHPPTTIPTGTFGQAVKAGQALFMDTSSIAGNKLSCTSCHLNGGTDEKVLPLVGVASIFPEYNKRAKSVITLSQRIDACVQYSEAGRPLPLNSPQIVDITAYLTWLSQGLPIHAKIPWLGTGSKIHYAGTVNVAAGQEFYAHVCAYCHGDQGQGFQHGFPAPPLWGPNSYAQGAGMSKQEDLSAFIKAAMPVVPVNGVSPGSIPAQTAENVAAYVLTHSRPQPGQ